MTILYDPSRNVKPTTPKTFAAGVFARKATDAPSAADREWWAYYSNAVLPPASGGSPGTHADEDLEWLAAEYAAQDAISRGLIAPDLAELIASTSLVGHPA